MRDVPANAVAMVGQAFLLPVAGQIEILFFLFFDLRPHRRRLVERRDA